MLVHVWLNLNVLTSNKKLKLIPIVFSPNALSKQRHTSASSFTFSTNRRTLLSTDVYDEKDGIKKAKHGHKLSQTFKTSDGSKCAHLRAHSHSHTHTHLVSLLFAMWICGVCHRTRAACIFAKKKYFCKNCIFLWFKVLYAVQALAFALQPQLDDVYIMFSVGYWFESAKTKY